MSTVYALCDPFPLNDYNPDTPHPGYAPYWWKFSLAKRVRYIGITDDVYRRFGEHLSRDEKSNQKKSDWIRTRKDRQVMIQCEILQQVDTDGHAQVREEFWIAYYHYLGAHLLNRQKYSWLPGQDRLEYVIEAHISHLHDPALQKTWYLWSHVYQDERDFVARDLACATSRAWGAKETRPTEVITKRTSLLSWHELYEKPVDEILSRRNQWS